MSQERKQGVNSSSVTTMAQLQTHNSLLFGGRIWLWDHCHGRLQVTRKRSDQISATSPREKAGGGEKLISAPDQQELSQLEAAVLSLQHNPSRKHLSWEVILSLRRSLKSAGSTFPELPVSISSSCATPRYRSSGQPLGGK